MQTSPDKNFFPLQILKWEQKSTTARLHCCIAVSSTKMSESVLNHLFNASWPRQMLHLQLAPMAKSMTLLESSDTISMELFIV